MDELVFRFLTISQITSFSQEDIHLQSLSHVDYPSIKAITDTLDYLKIGNKESIGDKDTITSKERSITKGFGLRDVSLIYFTSLFFTILFLGVHTSILLAIVIGALRIVGYSIYLQKTRLKHWCGLCLLASVVLISQFGTLLGMFSSWDFSLFYAFRLLVLSMALILLWKYVKPILVKSQKLLTTKKNTTFFTAALQEKIIRFENETKCGSFVKIKEPSGN